MKIKVLECIRQGQIGGGESHLLSLVENVNKEEFEPIVLSFTEGPMVTRLRESGIRTQVIYIEKPFDIRKWKTIRNFIEENEIDIVHAHGTRANSNVFWATKQLGLPLVYTIHGWSFHDDQNALTKRIRLWGEELLTRKSDVNITVSASNQQTGKKHFNNFDSIVITNGIDQNKFNPARSFKNIRSELNITPEVTLLLFVARFIHQKQPLKLIASFIRAIKEFPGLRLLMVGDGDQKSEAIEIARRNGINDKIIFQPFRQDVPDLLASADIFILPSLWEGLPIGLLEAMAMAKSIIATNVDGTSEVIQHHHNGLLIDTSNLENNLTNAILRLAKDEALRNRLGEQAKATITEKYSAATMTRQIENVYKELYHKVR